VQKKLHDSKFLKCACVWIVIITFSGVKCKMVFQQLESVPIGKKYESVVQGVKKRKRVEIKWCMKCWYNV